MPIFEGCGKGFSEFFGRILREEVVELGKLLLILGAIELLLRPNGISLEYAELELMRIASYLAILDLRRAISWAY